MTWTPADLDALRAKGLRIHAGASPKLANKYGAVATMRGKARFASKAEAAYWDWLMLQKRGGVVSYVLRQVPFHVVVDGDAICRYVADFGVFYTNGKVEWVDCKGMETATFKLKRKLVEAQFPIRLKLVKPSGGGWEEF